jgi:hypothetical protein
MPVKHLTKEMEYQKKDQKDHTRFTETTALWNQSSALLKTCDPVKSVAGIFNQTKKANFTLSSYFKAKLGYERARWHKIIWNTETTALHIKFHFML